MQSSDRLMESIHVLADDRVRSRGWRLRHHLKLLASRRELLFNLAMRDLKVRYKQSILGVAWAVIQPFGLMVVFSVIFSLLLKVKTSGVPYPVFSYVALVPWTYFTNGYSSGVASLSANANLVSKIYFPREIFPLASLLASFVDFMVAASIFVVILIYYHVGITWHILWLPLIILVQLAFMCGGILILSAANVFYRDIKLVLPFLLQLWMYVTPVIYPLSLVPARFRLLFWLNPMTGIIDAYRRTIVQGASPDFHLLAFSGVTSLILLGGGYWFFKSVEMQFADVI
jgi:lipopolysaccharide transport system permease protein